MSMLCRSATRFSRILVFSLVAGLASAGTASAQDPGPPPTLPPERSPTLPPEPGADPPPSPPTQPKAPPTQPSTPVKPTQPAKPATKQPTSPAKPTQPVQPAKPSATPPAKPVAKPSAKPSVPTQPAPASPATQAPIVEPPPQATSSKAPRSDFEAPPEPEPVAPTPEPQAQPEGPAPEQPPTNRPKPEDTPPETDEDTTKPKKKRKVFKHRGLIGEFKIGAAGCFKRICKGQGGHYAKPGLSLGGFLGGNIFGFADFGLEVQWATMGPRAYSGRNVVDLYGIDSGRLQELLVENASYIGTDFDVASLVLGTAKMRVLNVGPAVRLHVVPRGRVSAYVGTAFDYQLWRNKYETVGGPLRLDFHGIGIPLLGGLGFYPHPNVAVGFEFRWVYSYHVVIAAKHPDLNAGAPIGLIDMAGRDEGIEVSSGLPTFWHAVASVRARF